MKMVAVAVGAMLAAVLLVAGVGAAADGLAGTLGAPETCACSVDDVPGANTCICSKNCACAGKCIIAGGDGDKVRACFIECVLKNHCYCQPKHAAAAAP